MKLNGTETVRPGNILRDACHGAQALFREEIFARKLYTSFRIPAGPTRHPGNSRFRTVGIRCASGWRGALFESKGRPGGSVAAAVYGADAALNFAFHKLRCNAASLLSCGLSKDSRKARDS